MRQLIESLGDEIALLASYNVSEKAWDGRFPVFDAASTPLGSRLRRRLHLAPTGDQVSRRLAKRIARAGCTHLIIHFADEALSWVDLIKSFDGRVFVFCHGIDVTWNMRRNDAQGTAYHPKDYCERVRKLADDVTFVANSSHTTKQLHSIGVPSEKIAQFTFGCDLPIGDDSRVAAGTIDVIQVGRLVDFKGPQHTIRAFAHLTDEFQGIRLVIAGDGPMAGVCRLTAAELGVEDRVLFLGEIDGDAVQRLMSSSKVFTMHNCKGPLTNQKEAFGYAILEAMSHGLPVVCARSGGVVDFVEHGETALMFEPGDWQGQSEHLRNLLLDPTLRAKLGNAGRGLVAAQHSRRHMRRSLLAALALEK